MRIDRVLLSMCLAAALVLVAGGLCRAGEDPSDSSPPKEPSESKKPNQFVPSDSLNSPSLNTPGRSSERAKTSSTAKSKEKAGEKSTVPGREKLLKTIMRALGRMNPAGSPKKSLDDFWVIGTAELFLSDRHADIRFDSKQGQNETAEYLVDYILGAPQETIRNWHVFGRFKTSQDADEFLQECRRQYDAADAYRQQMADIYRARTTRRC